MNVKRIASMVSDVCELEDSIVVLERNGLLSKKGLEFKRKFLKSRNQGNHAVGGGK